MLVVVEAVGLQAGPLLSQIGIDDGITPGDWNVLVAVAVAAVFFVVVTALASGWRVAVTGRLSSRVMFELRVRVFAHLQRLSLDYYTDEKAGVIMTRMTSDVEALQQLLQEGLVQFAVQGLTMLVVTVVLFFYSVPLALITLLLIVPTLTGLSLWFRNASDRGYNRVRDGIAGVLSDLSESLSGVRVVAGFNRARNNVLHHRNVVGEYRDANDYTAEVTAVYGSGSEMIGVIGQAVLLFIGGTMVQDGTLSVGELVAFIFYLNSFFLPIQQLVQQYNLYQQGQAAIVKLNELLSTTPSVEESENAEVLPPISGDIVLEGVTFGYNPEVPVLRDVDLHIAAGRDDVVRRRDWCGEVDDRQARHALLRPHGWSRAHRRPRPAATSRSSRFAVSSAWFRRSLSCSRARSATTSRSPVRPPPTTRSGRRSTGSASPTSPTGCPRDSIRRCTNGVCRWRRGSASCSHSPARSSPVPACSYSTKPRRTSTSSRRHSWRRGSTPCSRGAPRSSSPTGSAPRCAPIGSPSSTTGASSSSARTPSLSPSGGRYAEMYAAWTEHLTGHDDGSDHDGDDGREAGAPKSGEMVAAPSKG